MFARLHPLIVHIPIGCIVLAFIAGWVLRTSPKLVKTGWLLAFGSGALACLTGYLLANQSEGYDPASIQVHQYSNMAITLLCGLVWWFSGAKNRADAVAKAGLLPLLGVLAGTYTGATMTHGSDFLTHITLQEAHKDDGGTLPSTDLPPDAAPAPDAAALAKARQRGLIIMPVGNDNNFLSVNAVNAPDFGDPDLALLAPLANNIVWLRLTDTRVTDAGLGSVAVLKNLTRLYLDHCAIKGNLGALAGLDHLGLLSLYGTQVTDEQLLQMPVLPKLKKVFLYKTPICGQPLQPLTAKFGTIVLDTGGYVLPVLAGDTVVVKSKY
jgi:uncharacterized membrane protein